MVVLESLIYITPGQASPDYDSARYRIVCQLRELSGVDVNSLCRREPGIHSVTTALHLKPGSDIRYLTLAGDRQKAAVTHGEWGFRSVNHFELFIRRGGAR